MRFNAMRFHPSLSAIVTVLALAGCDPLPSHSPESDAVPARAAVAGIPTEPTLAVDGKAVSRLDGWRRSLYDTLASESAVPLQITADLKTEAVLSIGLDWTGPSADPVEAALLFVKVFQDLLDTQVDAGEYVVQTDRTACGGTVTLDRFVGGLQVIGSRLTLHFDGRGHLVWVTNGVAPVSSKVIPVKDPLSLPGAQDLQLLMGNIKPDAAQRVAVLVPHPDGVGLIEGDLAAWVDETGRPFAAVAIGNVAVTRRLDAQGDGHGREGGSADSVADTTTGAGHAFVTYRDEGSALVSAFPAERNPLESAYRFLEEHPTLFRTGAARCQYVPTRLDENPSLPGVYTVRLRQMHGHLPVYGADMVVQLGAVDAVESITARTLDNVEVPTVPLIDANDAIGLAVADIDTATPPEWQQAVDEALVAMPETELVVFPRFLDNDLTVKDDKLAWRVTLGSFTILVDAETGKRLYETTSRHANRVIKDADGAGILGFLGYRTISIDGVVVSTTPPPSTEILPGVDGIPGGMPAALEDYNAFLERNGHFGRDGRGGGDFVANVGVNIETGCPNAFFDSTVTWTAFLCPGSTSADIVGHEMTHGVIAATSGLAYSDESGAINESYADLFGDLGDRTMNHLLGELVGIAHDLTDPSLSNPAQPTTYAEYVPRTAACEGAVFPWDCDFGNVHLNCGIMNRAHRLMSDGAAFTGIGDEKLERLVVATATSRLPSHATMNQVAAATRDVCEMFVRRGVVTATSGLAFTDTDCDAVNSAFDMVGLNPGYTSGWSEPQVGFFGTDTIHPAGADGLFPTTETLCPLDNILLHHRVPVLTTVITADYDPETPLPSSNTILDFVASTSFNFDGTTPTEDGPTPLGTPIKTHRVDWTSIYGLRPTYNTELVVDPTCTPPLAITRVSDFVTRGWDADNFGEGNETVTVGNPAPAAWDGTCILTGTSVELVDGDGNLLAGPDAAPVHNVTHWFLFVPANFQATASVVSPPAGLDMSGSIAVHWDVGMTARPRWRYKFIGEGCDPR